jgi:hypothetical protein
MTDRTSSPITLLSAVILSLGLIIGGYLLGNGLLRAKAADRSVTVRGLAEQNVEANLATWVMSYSANGYDLDALQRDIGGDTDAIRAFFAGLGDDYDLQPAGVNVSQYTDSNGRPNITIRQRMTFRTTDIALARKAVEQQFDLIDKGVVLEDGTMQYSFTKLDEIKPAMVAEATKDARRAAQQFAEDSGTQVGDIRSATQGYFSIQSRDGEGGGYGVADTPNKKVRVVTTVTFGLDN